MDWLNPIDLFECPICFGRIHPSKAGLLSFFRHNPFCRARWMQTTRPLSWLCIAKVLSTFCTIMMFHNVKNLLSFSFQPGLALERLYSMQTAVCVFSFGKKSRFFPDAHSDMKFVDGLDYRPRDQSPDLLDGLPVNLIPVPVCTFFCLCYWSLFCFFGWVRPHTLHHVLQHPIFPSSRKTRKKSSHNCLMY